MEKTFLVIINPVPSRARKKVLNKFVQYLKAHQLSYELYPTEASISANRHYFKSNIEKFTDLIVIGGDGTFHNVINSLPDSYARPIGLIPAGTGNDFSRWLYGKERTNLPFIFEQVTGKCVTNISLGKCTFSDGSVRLFHNVLGFGFDAMLAKELRDSKGLFKSLGYLFKAAQKLPFYKGNKVKLQLDEQTLNYTNLITAFGNSQYFGAGMKITPSASPLVPGLDMCRVPEKSRLSIYSQLLRLFNGSHVKQPFVDYQEIETAILLTSNIDVEADGEYLGTSPCEISSIANGLKIKRF